MFKKNGKTTTLGIIQPPVDDKVIKDKKSNKNEKEVKQENKASK